MFDFEWIINDVHYRLYSGPDLMYHVRYAKGNTSNILGPYKSRSEGLIAILDTAESISI